MWNNPFKFQGGKTWNVNISALHVLSSMLTWLINRPADSPIKPSTPPSWVLLWNYSRQPFLFQLLKSCSLGAGYLQVGGFLFLHLVPRRVNRCNCPVRPKALPAHTRNTNWNQATRAFVSAALGNRSGSWDQRILQELISSAYIHPSLDMSTSVQASRPWFGDLTYI